MAWLPSIHSYRPLITGSLAALLALGATVLPTPGSPSGVPVGQTVSARSAISVGKTATGRATTIRFYLIAANDKGKSGQKIGCGDSLVGVTYPKRITGKPWEAALRLLLNIHQRFYGQSGLYNALYQSSLTLKRSTLVAGRLTVYLTGRLRSGGSCDAPRIAGQLRQTARQTGQIRSVSIFINNIRLSKLLSGRP